MDVLIKDADVKDLSILSKALEEYRQHSSARGQFAESLAVGVTQEKLQKAVDALLLEARIANSGKGGHNLQ